MRFTRRLAVVVAICTIWLGAAAADAQPSLADLAAKSRPSDLPGTEQEWIVRTVASRLAVLAALPSAAPEPTVAVTTLAASPAVFSVSVNGATAVTVKVVGHIWDPRTYLPVAAALGVRAGATDDATPASNAALAEAVSSLSLTDLLDHDAKVSAALRERPRSAALHEQAALLLGAFSLREGAGLYTDGRPARSRLTAHLVMARAVDPARSSALAGRLAEALLLVEVGREADALSALAPLADAQQPEPVRAWALALRVRVTGDWRLITRPTKSAPVVRAAYARAYAWRAGMAPLLAWIDDSRPEVDLPLLRIMLSQAFTVAVGSQYSAVALTAELADAEAAAAAYAVTTGRDPAALFAAIGRPASAGAFRVLDWPLVASAAERHVVARAKSVFDAEVMFGRRERLRQLPGELEKALATLPLLPTALALMGGESAPRHLAAAAAIVRARKDAIPPALWTALVQEGQRSARAVSWPTNDVWFNPWEPDGTALTPSERLVRQGAPKPPLPMVEALHRLAPSDTYLSWRLAWWRLDGAAPTIAAMRAEVGPAVAYDAGAIYRMFKGLDGSHDEYVTLGTEMCEMNVDRCEDLAQELLKEGRDGEAAVEMRRWFTRATDRVAASNGVLWLTRYLFDQGQGAEARAVAAKAADVASARGIMALAELMEREGDSVGAESRFRQVQERYGSAWYLGEFYLRRWKATGDAAQRDRGLSLVAEWFPAGFQLPPSDGTAPVDGIAFTNFGARAAHVGLRKSDIVVGIDGVRVRSEAQAGVLLRASHDAAMQFTVWRDGAYTTLKGTLPQRWLGCGYKTYRPPASTP